MSDTLSCPVCGHWQQRESIEADGCEHCNATVVLITIMNDIINEHLEDLEAAGVSIYTAVGISEPAVIPYLRSLWLEKEELKTNHAKLGVILKNIDSALHSAKGFV